MPVFSFFLLLHTPTCKDNLDYMQHQIETCIDTVPLNTEELRDSTNRLFAYLYDLFNNASLLAIDKKTQKNKKKEELSKIRDVAKAWFMDASQDFFLKMFGPKSIWLLLAIHKHYNHRWPQNVTKLPTDPSVIITDTQLDFNQFLVEVQDGACDEIFHILTVFCFAIQNPDTSIGVRYLRPLMLKLLNHNFIKRLRNSKNISFDYFFNHLYDLYYAHREELKVDMQFVTSIAALREEE